MRRAFSGALKRVLAHFDRTITRQSHLAQLERDAGAAEQITFLRRMPSSMLGQLISVLDQSAAQNRQDLFALAMSGFRRNGYFVEFGATNGVIGSNSYLLETAFGWNGIVAEPARVWHDQLRTNRRCHIDTDCVWSASGETVTFSEVDKWPGLSTIASFADSDSHSAARRKAHTYQVPTVSLVDLLQRHQAPCNIDYLSVDTEGTELSILSAFDFARYRVRLITCEHNFTAARASIHQLLARHGYTRVWTELSKYDDWYVLDLTD